MLTHSSLTKLEQTHKLDNFDIHINELSKDGEVFEIDLLYSYDMKKSKMQQLIKSGQQTIKKEYFTTIPKYNWRRHIIVKYSDDFVEKRDTPGGCLRFCH